MNDFLGTTSGVLASLSWAVSILLFARALRDYGALSCNFFKASLALLLFVVASTAARLVFGIPWPSACHALFLFLSGVVGMAFGDFAFFQAIVKVGPRQAALIHSTNPVFLLAFSLFSPDDSLTFLETVGVVTVVAAVLDVTRQQKGQSGQGTHSWNSGLVWGVLAALSQALGIVIARDAAMSSHPVHTGMIRLFGAAVGMLGGLVFLGKARSSWRLIREPHFLKVAALPVFLGTFLGILLMMLAIATCKPAVAGAVLSLAPVFLVPLTAWQARRPIPLRILLGTIVALVGVVLISSGMQ